MNEQREIKFRAWNKHHKQMYEVLCLDFNNGVVNALSKQGTTHTFGFIALELMQFTGRKDTNGQEIYESDIFKATKCQCPKGMSSAHNVWYHVPQFFVVEYRNVGFYGINKDETLHYAGCEFRGGAICDLSKETEILGNVFENPDLLTLTTPQP